MASLEVDFGPKKSSTLNGTVHQPSTSWLSSAEAKKGGSDHGSFCQKILDCCQAFGGPVKVYLTSWNTIPGKRFQ
jgi:hypothetical protein